MTVAPDILSEDSHHLLLAWTLTLADDVADPSPPFPHRNIKTVDVYEAGASGWGTATVQVQGDLNPSGAGQFKLLNTIPDTVDLSFTANATKHYVVLPHVMRVKPVKTAGDFGANGVTIKLLVMSMIRWHRINGYGA